MQKVIHDRRYHCICWLCAVLAFACACLAIVVFRYCGDDTVEYKSVLSSLQYGVRVSRRRGVAQIFISSRASRRITFDGYPYAFKLRFIPYSGHAVVEPNTETIDVVGPSESDWVVLGQSGEYVLTIPLGTAEGIESGTLELISTQRSVGEGMAGPEGKEAEAVRLAPVTRWRL